MYSKSLGEEERRERRGDGRLMGGEGKEWWAMEKRGTREKRGGDDRGKTGTTKKRKTRERERERGQRKGKKGKERKRKEWNGREKKGK